MRAFSILWVVSLGAVVVSCQTFKTTTIEINGTFLSQKNTNPVAALIIEAFPEETKGYGVDLSESARMSRDRENPPNYADLPLESSNRPTTVMVTLNDENRHRFRQLIDKIGFIAINYKMNISKIDWASRHSDQQAISLYSYSPSTRMTNQENGTVDLPQDSSRTTLLETLRNENQFLLSQIMISYQRLLEALDSTGDFIFPIVNDR